MPHPPADWDTYLRKFLSVYQPGVERRSSREAIAKEAGIPGSAVGNLQVVLQHIGALDMRYGPNPEPDAKFGKATYTTVVFTHDEIMAEMKRQGLDFTVNTMKKLAKESGRSQQYRNQRYRRGIETVTDKSTYVPRSPTAALDLKLGPQEMSVPPKNPDSPMEVLRPLLKDEPKALIEAARQYRERSAFIREKVEEFERHGLKLDPASIGVPEDPRMEIILLVLPYVEALEKSNERLSKTGVQVRVDDENERKLRGQIAELQREKRMAAEAAERMLREQKNKHAEALRQQEREFEARIAQMKKGEPHS